MRKHEITETNGICECEIPIPISVSPQSKRKVRMQRITTVLKKASKSTSSCQKVVCVGLPFWNVA